MRSMTITEPPMRAAVDGYADAIIAISIRRKRRGRGTIAANFC
jgi:hypothetical protein